MRIFEPGREERVPERLTEPIFLSSMVMVHHIGSSEVWADCVLHPYEPILILNEKGADTEGYRRQRCASERYRDYFDSKDFQIRTPIYYFQGRYDIATPIEGALYHHDNQVESKNKTFVTITVAGHAPTSLQIVECMNSVWQRIFQLRAFDGVLKEDGTCVRAD